MSAHGSNSKLELLVFGGLDGRLDHTLQNLNSALVLAQAACEHRLVFVTDACSAEMLLPGHVCVTLENEEGMHCGLVPLSGSARVVTRGLEWELERTAALEMAWGGLLSTSNKVRKGACEVYVESETPLLWILEGEESS